jgi:hypothetical protein
MHLAAANDIASTFVQTGGVRVRVDIPEVGELKPGPDIGQLAGKIKLKVRVNPHVRGAEYPAILDEIAELKEKLEVLVLHAVLQPSFKLRGYLLHPTISRYNTINRRPGYKGLNYLGSNILNKSKRIRGENRVGIGELLFGAIQAVVFVMVFSPFEVTVGIIF